ncbi:unnamed protein product [Didymodactylos carnosus]|uniref:Uncharacterized protein n=1 Tax=Didymodactylos carnosus TaxID=1234261 RepID=A0A813NGM3_9BILA|nr:unnamed protein product [Didymodactylos carnosus]CAF0866346.1 unnamed protein product [Didymodactylos carnosus]CAF3516522.1 unnamed protein product [Didymodactylos carnosus]CAF3651156.1 unnamed protein product [Didymodactylos carnosus]
MANSRPYVGLFAAVMSRIRENTENSATINNGLIESESDGGDSLSTHSRQSYDYNYNSEEEEEKLQFISQVLVLQKTLDDLSKRVDSVKEENLKLRSENQVLGQYIENLMAASNILSLFEHTMSVSPSNLEIQGSFMRVPPPKEVTKSLERRSSHEQLQQRHVSYRSSIVTPIQQKPKLSLTKTEQNTNKQPVKNDETETMRTKIVNLEDEIRRLKRKIEELEKEIIDLQKQIRTKDKKIAELTKENEDLKKTLTYQKQVDDFKLANTQLLDENEQLKAEINRLEMAQKNAAQSNEEVEALREHYERQLKQMRQEHAKELKQRDDKIEFLKKQIADSLKDNSWERQAQIEVLTKELKRTHEEYELIKHKLLSYQNKKGSCANCSDMLARLEVKTKALREKDSIIQELVTLMQKFKTQLTNQDDLMKLLSTYNNTSIH